MASKRIEWWVVWTRDGSIVAPRATLAEARKYHASRLMEAEMSVVKVEWLPPRPARKAKGGR